MQATGLLEDVLERRNASGKETTVERATIGPGVIIGQLTST